MGTWRNPRYAHPDRCPHCNGKLWDVDDDGVNLPEWQCVLCCRVIQPNGLVKQDIRPQPPVKKGRKNAVQE